VGAVILPNLAIVALFLVPFIDRGRVTAVARRTMAMGVVAIAAIGWTTLTMAALRDTPAGSEEDVIAQEGAPAEWTSLSPEELAGIGYFRKENCASCHAMGTGEAKVGPDLSKTAIKRDANWMLEHFKRPQEMRPGSQMPAIHLPDSQLNALAAFLLKLHPENVTALMSAPDAAVDGAMIYQQNRCGSCHQVNGVGMKLGPPMNGLGRRRDRKWVEGHFADPQKFSPGTVMPPYRLAPQDMDRLTSYLMSL
jgi:ubiquinol-cytochrome c reductase cytochrome b subunit